MYQEEISYFKSEYDKNIILYGKQTIYEPLRLSEAELYNALDDQKDRGIQSTPICFGVRLGKKVHGRLILIFERLSFSIKDVNLLKNLFLNETDDEGNRDIEGIFFIDCQFLTPLTIEEPTEADVCFRNCVFERDINFYKAVNSKIIFNQCRFSGMLGCKDTQICSMFYIENCQFKTNSALNLNKSCFTKNADLVIRDTQFCGKFEADSTRIEGSAKFFNLSFFNPFNISSLKLSEECQFQNFAFNNGNSKGMLDAQEKLSKTLKKNGYLLEIEELGLNTNKQNLGFDEEEYQGELVNGSLRTKAAARYLGLSVSYLTQKRARDKKIKSRDALPTTGKGKNLRYPLDALKAFVENDWQKLKELRKKYETKEEEKED